MRSRILKIFAVFVLVIIVGIASISLLIKTSFVQNKIVDLIKSSVSKSTGQQLNIGKVDFVVTDGIVINDTELKIDNNKFLEAKSITLGYPLSALNFINDISAGHINVDSFKIDGLSLVLSKNEDGEWNYRRLSRKDTKREVKPSTQKVSSNWIVSINSFEILDTWVSIINKETSTERNINIADFRSEIKLKTNPPAAEIKLNTGQINIDPDEIIINNLSSSTLKLSKEDVEIGELIFDFNGAEIFMSGKFKNSDEKLFSVSTRINDFSNEIIKLNLDFKGDGAFRTTDDINAKFSLNITDSKYLENKFALKANEIKITDSILNIKSAALVADIGQAGLNLNSDLKKIFDENQNNEFTAALKITNLDYSKLKSTLPSEIESLASNIHSDMNFSGFFNSKDDFDISTDINKFAIEGDGGNAVLQGNINTTDKLINSDIHGSTNNLDFGYFLTDSRYKSSINSKFKIDAVFPLDFDLNKLSGFSNIKILNSTIFNDELKSGDLRAKFSPNRIEDVSVKLNSNFLNIDAAGRAVNEKLDFSYDISSTDLSFISYIKTGLDLGGSMKVNGKVNGELQAPNIDYFLELSDFGFKNIKVATGKSKGTIDIDEGISKIDTNGKLERLYYKDRAFESLEFNLSTKEADALGIISLQENDKNNYDLEFKIPDIKNEKRIEFSKIELNFGDAQFNNDKKLQVDYSDGLKISGLNLGSNNSRLAGEVSFSKKNNLRGDIDFKSFELQNLSELLDMKEPVSGVVNGKINISGSAVSPRFKSDLNINDLKFRDFISEKITLNSSYLDNEIKINLNSDLQDNNKLNLSGVINSGISFGEDKSSFDISGFDLTLLSNNLNLSPFSAFTSHLEEINGVVDLDLKIKGKPQSPKLIGSTNIENTVFKLKQLKNKITINSGQILLDGDKAKFNDFDLSSGEGSATLNGDLNFTDFSYKTLADFDNFMINPKRINTNLSGKLKINGKSEDIYAEGDISLNRTRITISQQKKQQVSEIKFVDELEDEKGEIVIKDEQKGSYFKDNTALDLNVTIPKNSWVRGRGANIELKGALKIDKEYKDDPLITGNISTVRGTYKIFGKLFKIQEGNVNFPGIKELNPLLDVTALYNVSDVDVFVGIGGDVKNPSVKLSSNPALQETDIISYLIFGTSSDQLGTGERSALGSAATGLAGGVALNQLKGVLGDDVSPDVLSFGTGTAGPELEVGKYLNDDIYFAYERKSSSDSGSSIPTNTVKVEYRLLDFLSVGSDVGSEQSGGDLFFKFEY